MAAEKIEFALGSKFKGEGFKAATQAIKDNRQEINAARQGIGALTSAFKEVSPEAAAAVGAVQKFGQAFVTGGIVGGVISLALQGLAKAVSFVSEKMHEAAEASKKYADILRNEVLAAMGDSSAQFQKLSEDIGKANREIKDSLALLNGDVAREAQNKVHELHIATLQKITDDMSAEGRASLLAQEQLTAQQIKAAAALEQATNAVNSQKEIVENTTKKREAAEQAVVDAETRLAELRERSAEYLQKRQALDNAIENVEQQYKDGMINLAKYREQQKQGALKVAELEETYKEQIEKLADATSKVEEAKRNAAAATDAEAAAARELETAELKVADVKLKNEAERADAELKLNDAKKKEQEAIEKETEAHQEVLDLCGGLYDAWNAWIDETEKLADAEAQLTEDIKNGAEDSGKVDPNKVQKVNVVRGPASGIGVNVEWNPLNQEIQKPKGLDDATWNRFRNGLANVADMQKVHRFQERQQRDQEMQLKRIEADSIKFLKIADTPESWRSKADNAFMEIYKQKVLPQLPKEMAAKMLGDAGKHILAKEDMKEFLGDKCAIIKYLEKLGLK